MSLEQNIASNYLDNPTKTAKQGIKYQEGVEDETLNPSQL